MNSEESVIPVENGPRPFGQIPALWLKLFGMSEEFFRAELPRASASNTFFAILALAVVTAILSALTSLLFGFVGLGSAVTASARNNSPQTIISTAIIQCCFGLFVTPIGFYLNNGLNFVVAKIFGGKGGFGAQAYLVSLFYVPLALLSSLAALLVIVPVAGPILFLLIVCAVIVIHFVMFVRVFKTVHGLSTGAAIGALLAPIILLGIPLCLIAVLTIMGPLVGKVFATINASLGTPGP